jgi:AMP nucleosidase
LQESEDRIRIVTEAFIVVQTAEQAVDRLAELHERATRALSLALKRYLKDRVEPDAEQRSLFRYPELRLTYEYQGEVPATTRAYAKVQLPGTYSVTVTHPTAFRNYLLEQLVPLMHDFTVKVEVGVSEQDIPYPYVVEQGDELAGSGVTAAALARVFPSTDLSAATACMTGKIASRCPWRCSMRRGSTFPCGGWCITPAATGGMCNPGSC